MKQAKKRKSRKVFSAGGFVFNGCDVLVVEDSYGKMTVPKGHIEQGEANETAALREIVEETGLENLRIVGKLKDNDYVFTESDGSLVFKKVYMFLVESRDRKVMLNKDELSGYKWVDADKMPGLIGYKDMANMARAASKLINNLCKKTK